MPRSMEPISLALAPMEGVTDDVVRELFAALGGVDYCVTEFVPVSDAALPAKVLLRECPELRTGGRTARGVAVHFQLLGGDPDRMARTAATAVELSALSMELNFLVTGTT